MRLGVPTAVLFLFATLLVGPATSHLLAAPAAAQVTTPTFEAKIKNTAYNPPVITILKGTSVRWTNEDSGPTGLHSVTSDAGTPTGSTFDQEVFPTEFKGSAVNVYSKQFNAVAVIKYSCKHHASMHGEIRVVAQLTTPYVTVTVKDASSPFRFDPNSLHINLTQKLNFTNAGATATHNVVFEDAAIGKVGELPAGTTTTLTVAFTKNAIYKYRCTYHSTDFNSGMKGNVLVGNGDATKGQPSLTIKAPTPGTTVKGTVEVNGNASAGPGGVNVTGVEIRIGLTGTWTAATVTGGEWKYSWDSTKIADGLVTIFVRPLSKEFSDPQPATVDVTVANAGAVGSSSTAPTVTPTKDKGGIPAPDASLVLVALAAVLVVARRKE